MKPVFCRAAAAVCAAAIFPAWIYYFRFAAGLDNLLPLLALAVACGYFIYGMVKTRRSARGNLLFLAISAFLLALYAIAAGRVPSLATVILAFLALGTAFLACYPLEAALRRLALPALLVLALPMEDSLQFYLGYPLRALTTAASAAVLMPAGVDFSGTTLLCRGAAVEVDAPCSGVTGLWVFAAAAMALSLARRHGAGKTALNALAAFAAALLYNIARTSLLFLSRAEGPAHAAAGIAAWAFAFMLYAAFFILILEKIKAKPETDKGDGKQNNPATAFFAAAYLAASMFAAAAGIALPGGDKRTVETAAAFTGWPVAIGGRRLAPLPLSESDKKYFAAFPGGAARFRLEGGGEVLFRYVTRPTRMLHFAEDCYEAGGIRVKRLEMARLVASGLPVTNALWSVFEADRGGEKTRVLQAVFSLSSEKSYPDPSSWYWNTVLPSSDRGPWLAVTWEERAFFTK